MRRLGFCVLFVALHGIGLAVGPFGGTVNSLQLEAETGVLSWAATNRGLFRYHNDSWQRISALAQRDLRRVVALPRRLLVVDADGQLLSSPDAGATWSPAGRIQGRYGHQTDAIYTLVADPENPARLFLGTAGDGPFETRDQGDTWNSLAGGLEAEPPQAYHAKVLLAPRGGRPLLMGTLGRGLFAYRDGVWQPHGDGLPPKLRVEALVENPSNPDHLALASRGAGLWQSRDAGAHWARVRKGRYGVVGPISIGYDGTVLAHFPEEGLVTVHDGKASRPGSLQSARVHDLVARVGGGWFAGLDHDGVLRITAGSEIVDSVNQGLTATRVLSLSPGADGGSLWAGDTNGVFFSSSGGSAWEARDAGLLGAAANVLLRSGSELFLGSGGQGVYRWIPQASSWEPRSTGLGTSNIIFAFAEDVASNSFYVGTEGGVLRSDDRGGLWTRTNAGLKPAGEWRVAASSVQPARFWAAGGGTLYQTDDGGSSWRGVAQARPVALVSTAALTGEVLWVLEGTQLSRFQPDGAGLAAVLAAGRGERFTCVLPADDTVWVGSSSGLWALTKGGEARRAWQGAGVLALQPTADGGLYLGTDGAGVVRLLIEQTVNSKQ